MLRALTIFVFGGFYLLVKVYFSMGRFGQGFTLIELLIVIAIIGILAAIALPMYNANRIRARMTEVTNAMATIGSAVSNYSQEMKAGGSVAWPNCPDISSIQSSLGVGVGAVTRISTARVDQGTGEIQATVSNIDPTVDGRTLSLIPTVHDDGSISWAWAGTIQTFYMPKVQ
jgi:type IV pilus assembly protein PilA